MRPIAHEPSAPPVDPVLWQWVQPTNGKEIRFSERLWFAARAQAHIYLGGDRATLRWLVLS